MQHLSIIKYFKALLKTERFIVTGGTVLQLHGLKEKAPDLDLILVNPSEEALTVLRAMQEASPAKTKPFGGGGLAAILMHEGVKVDFWIQNDFKETTLNYLGEDFEIANVGAIIRAKKSIGRFKDFADLKIIAARIHSEKAFNEAFIDTFGKHYTGEDSKTVRKR